MAYTTIQLAALEEAIASGVLSVRHTDGRSTTFHSLSEMRKLRDEMRGEIDAGAGRRRRRTMRVFQSGSGL